jgi:hypothetical protein
MGKRKKIFMKNNIVVYTAMFDDYDDLQDPISTFNGCDFICFTDSDKLKNKIKIWKIVNIKKELDPIAMNRKIKILAHKYLVEYERSIYVDSNIRIIGNPFTLAQKYLSKYDFAVPTHFMRSCVYDEIKACFIYKKIDFYSAYSLYKKYLREGLPKNASLSENNVILRNHKKDIIIQLMEEWWKEIVKNKIYRDQIFLNYVFYKKSYVLNFIEEKVRDKNDFFEYLPHKKTKKINNIIFRILNKIDILLRKIILSLLNLFFKI